MKKHVALFSFFLLLPCVVYAATGDIVWKCDFEGAGTSPLQVISNCGEGAGGVSYSGSTIKPSGGHNNGKYINFFYPNTGEVYAPFGLTSTTIRKTELTYEYYEKFDRAHNDNVDLWNVKSSRVLDNISGYFGFVAREYAGYWEQTTVPNGRTLTFEMNSNITLSPGSPCTNLGGNKYSCPDGRIAFKPTTNSLINDTLWHKVRYYVKWPSGASASDGVIKFWLDDILIYTTNNIPGWTGMGGLIGEVRFNPSIDLLSGNKATFNHSYDDIIIYEGYVPPTPSISAPGGVKATVTK